MTKEYYCSECGYKNDIKQHVERHLNKAKKCGENPVVEVRNIEIRCDKCTKIFNSYRSLNEHKKKCIGIGELSSWPSVPPKTERTEIFYIIQERESVRMNEPVYKIGRTSKNFIERFKQYPTGSRSYLVYSVSDSRLVENLVRERFMEDFTLIRGHEYFEGPLHEMIQTACEIIHSQ